MKKTGLVSPKRRATLLASAACALLATVRGPQAKTLTVYRDASLPIAARVSDLLGRMTLDEKLWQLVGCGDMLPVEDGQGNFAAGKASMVFPFGIGHICGISLYSGRDLSTPQRDAVTQARYVNAVQTWALKNTRLAIPVLFQDEALHGYRARGATMFPQAIGLAASFDPDMVSEVFSVAAAQARGRGVPLVLAPVLDVARDPRWGRVEETFGEDPYLCGEIGLAAVRGLQGDVLPLPKDKVFATLKHFVADAESVNGSNTGPANMGERQLREVHFRPFSRVIKALPVRSVMVTYNEIDGVPCAANPWLLNDVLRGEWHFKGMVIADYDAVKQLSELHQVAGDKSDAAVLAINAGVDVELPQPEAFLLLKNRIGKDVSMARLDEAVSRVLTVKFEAGLFENPFVDLGKAAAHLAGADDLAVRAAARSMVLLKNANKTLPLRPGHLKRVLVVGHAAKDTPYGEYSGQPEHVVSVLEGLKTAAHGRFDVAYSEGVRVTETQNWYADTVSWTPDAVNDGLIAAAEQSARDCDVIVMVLGANEEITREAWSSKHLGDRSVLGLMGRQDDLAEAMFEAGKPVIAVLLNGSPIAAARLAEKADALLEAWYGGQETGTGVAAILMGEVNPGAKLPISVPRSPGQLPVYYNRKPTARRGYVDGTVDPLFPFGFGLSYTSFDISTPRAKAAPLHEPTIVEVDIVNTGDVAGDEVVQVYLRHPFASVTLPVKELKAFRRISLEAGERRTLLFSLDPDSFGYWDHKMTFVSTAGTVDIMVGNSSANTRSVSVRRG